MSYGLNVTNSFDYVQIDQNYSNFVIHESGSVTVSDYFYPATIPVTEINGFAPLLFVRANSGQSFCVSHKFLNALTQVWKDPNDTNAVTVEWFTCTPIDYIPPSETDYGLHVYKSDGTIAFSSNKKYQQIYDVIDFGTFTTSGATVTKQFTAMPDGQKPFICASLLYSATWVVQITTNMAGYGGIYISQPSLTEVTLKNTLFRAQQGVYYIPSYIGFIDTAATVVLAKTPV